MLETLNSALIADGPPGHFTSFQFSYLGPQMDNSVGSTVGFASNAKTENTSMDTLYGWGSITKQFLNSILLTYQGEGKLALEDTLGALLPEYFEAGENSQWPQEWEDIKLYQVLNMTSGIPDYFEALGFFVEAGQVSFLKLIESDMTFVDIVDLAAKFQKTHLSACQTDVQACFTPGSKYYYSNTDYMLVGIIVEKISATSVSDLFSKYIYPHIPAGETAFLGTGVIPSEILSQMAQGYSDIFAPLAATGTDVTNWPYYWLGPAGGFLGNTAALNGLIQALYQGEIVGQKQTDMFLNDYFVNKVTGQLVSDISSECTGQGCYGLGVEVQYSSQYGRIYFYHGQSFGYSTQFSYLPCYNLTLSLSKNSSTLSSNYIADTLESLLDELSTSEPTLFLETSDSEFCSQEMNVADDSSNDKFLD